MLNNSLIIAIFTSILWILHSQKAIAIHPNDVESLYQIVIIYAVPLCLVWLIFAILRITSTNNETSNSKITEQLERHTERTNAINCTLIEIEKHIKSEITLHKLEILIDDCNEILSDIIKRSNSISSTQMEHLWSRTAGGERWLIAKTFVETYNFQPIFIEHLKEKAQKDNVLKGSILEFEARIQCLYQLLESNDTQQIFYNMIQYGAMGKSYNILAPIAAQLKETKEEITKTETIAPQNKINANQFELTEEVNETFPSFLTMPKQSMPDQAVEKQQINNIQKPQSDTNMNKEDEQLNRINSIDEGMKAIRKELLSSETSKPKIITSFSSTQQVLDNMKKEQKPSHNHKKNNKPIKSQKIISLDEIEKEIEASPENNYDEYASPFGAWKNDK